MVITTARKPSNTIMTEAETIAVKYSIPYIPRSSLTLTKLLQQHDAVLVLSKERLVCHTHAGKFFLHPNMAALRIKSLRQGKTDRMLEAMGLNEGDSMLDCTAGLCADSLVARYQVGETGKIVALERSLPIFLVAQHGLRNSLPQRFQQLGRGINLVHADFRRHLKDLGANSFDVVYFDPMFDVPVKKSVAFQPIRPLAIHSPLEPSDIQLASRVARRRVVVKQRGFYNFARLGLTPTGSQSGAIAYGMLNTEKEA